MKIKPTGPYCDLEGRIDGVAYGHTRYGCVGNWWHYPTSSPSPFFNQVNTFIRQTDLLYGGFSAAQKEEWEDWTDELNARELCDLLKGLFTQRSTYDAGKAGFVNCSAWRAVQGFGITTAPPANDALPSGDSISIVSTSPFLVHWTRTGDPIPFSCYYGIYAALVNTLPALDIVPQKLSFVGTWLAIPNATINLSAVVAPLVAKWPNKPAQFAFCPSVVGSCPFQSFQVGALLT